MTINIDAIEILTQSAEDAKPDVDPEEEMSVDNAELSQESFETFKDKIAQLCHNLGHGEPSQILRMKGGSSNQVIGIRLPDLDKQDYIVRIPRFNTGDHQGNEILDQVSVLLHISEQGFARTPSILAYDSTTNNAIGKAFVIQERIHGESLQDTFYQLPLSEKLQITTTIAELIVRLDSVSMDKPGRLIGKRTLPDTSYTPPKAPGIDITGFREDYTADQPAVDAQQLTPLIIQLFQNHKDSEEYVSTTAQKFSKLQEIAKQMSKAGLVRVADAKNVLWAWDLNARHILLRKVEPPKPLKPAKVSQQNFEVTVGDPSTSYKQTVKVDLQNGGVVPRNTIQTEIINNQGGKTYLHLLEIEVTGPSASNDVTENLSDQQSTVSHNPLPVEWEISGIVDWDDVMSAPLVLTRKPPTWLWDDEDYRTSGWDGDCDTKLTRDLTQNEMVVKAHFDQVIARLAPTYIDDAYHRGLWLRRLARFAIYGFSDDRDIERYEAFVEEWDAYYQSLVLDY